MMPPSVIVFGGFFILFTLFQTCEGKVVCQPDGNCAHKDHPSDVEQALTACANCKSCTFENCCHRRYTSPYVRCEIPGWRAPDYSGGIKRGYSKKRDGSCFSIHDCPSDVLSACVKDHHGDARGYCVIHEGPLPHPGGQDISQQKSAFALIVWAVAGIGGWEVLA
ncbi:hypothetical protein Ddc_12991 [Ditylenchus destructor]|nr:hypothetical protein Ddc_12991 [Ditylenchus destructor]